MKLICMPCVNGKELHLNPLTIEMVEYLEKPGKDLTVRLRSGHQYVFSGPDADLALVALGLRKPAEGEDLDSVYVVEEADPK